MLSKASITAGLQVSDDIRATARRRRYIVKKTMAHFIPENCDRDKRPVSEQAVFDIIERCLSDDWVVFHSFAYLIRDPLRLLNDGEIDFLLYHEQKGFVAIEVKGGTISYLNGQWLQNGKPRQLHVQQSIDVIRVPFTGSEAADKGIPLTEGTVGQEGSCTCTPYR